MFVSLFEMSLNSVYVCMCVHDFSQADSGFRVSCLDLTSAADCCRMTLLMLNDSLKWNNELSKYDCGVQKDVRLGKVIRPLPPGHKIWFVYI